MLEEYVRYVSRDQLLTDEERRRLSAENLAAASQRFAPLYRLPAAKQSASEPEPADRPERFDDMRAEETRAASARSRMEMTARNRNAAAAARPARPAEPKEIPVPITEPVRSDEEASERSRARDRRRMSEENRRAAADMGMQSPPADRKKRHRVPTDEELIAELRAKKAADREREESDRMARMQASQSNFRRSQREDDSRAYVPAFVSGVTYVSGSSAVAVRPEERMDDETQEEAAPDRQPEMLPETVPEQDAGRIHATEGGRFSLARFGKLYPKRMNTVRTVLVGAVAVALIGMVIYGRVQTNEIYTEIAEYQAKYDDIVARNVSMRSEMEGKMTVKNIEEYATDVLGLKQLDQSQIQYIQIQTEDEVTITEPESNWLVTLNDYLSEIWHFFTRR